MLLGLCLIFSTTLLWAVAATARPAASRTRRRDVDRRLRRVRQHPDQVHLLDVENLLLGDSIPASTVDRVMRRARRRQLGARTMWRWAASHGTDKLVLVVDADLSEDSMLDHLDAGTSPRWASLRVAASLGADTFGDPEVRVRLADRSTVVVPDDLRVLDSMPPIADPGLQPFLRTTDGESGGGSWPHVA
jgi:hypothetical protein